MTSNLPAIPPAQSPGLATTISYLPTGKPLGAVPLMLELDTKATLASAVTVPLGLRR